LFEGGLGSYRADFAGVLGNGEERGIKYGKLRTIKEKEIAMTEYNKPLAPFSRLVGGEWHMDDAFHTFEWGVDRKILKITSYFVAEGNPVLVSEGFWFWHPGKKVVQSYSVAIEMGVELFVYHDSRWDGEKMINDMTAYDANGAGSDYVEEWEFTDQDTYVWTLYAKTPEGLKKSMGGTFKRK
jgi:hypothetical protein